MIRPQDLDLAQLIDEPANVVDAIFAFCEAHQDLWVADRGKQTGSYL
jgi:hypothetical protein